MKIGPEELQKLSFCAGENVKAPTIPFSEDVIQERDQSHILIFTPRIEKLTLVGMRGLFGVDPKKHEPCMYDQDWYLEEDFAHTPPDGKWHLVRKETLEDARGKQPDDIASHLSNETFPTAITTAFTFFAWYELRGEILWKHDFLWCSDRDHNGDRIYVGRYVDPEGTNKKGFNVHRHLSIRPSFSAAPEITGV